MSKKLDVKVYSINNDGIPIEHTEIIDYHSELDKDGNLVSFDFCFTPLFPVSKVVAKIVEVDK